MNHLETHKLGLSRNGNWLFRNLDLKIPSGSLVAILGPSGVGKSSLLSCLSGSEIQTEGKIEFHFKNGKVRTTENINPELGIIFQSLRLTEHVTVLENVRVGLMPDSIWKMITESPNVDREIELALSVGFSESDLRRTPDELSMGDLRKLEMARTMATNPRIMLLDEVFAGLTVGEIDQIAKLIQKMRSENMTFLIVSHDLKALEPLVDDAIAINYGKVIAQGSFASVISDKAVRTSYLGT